MNKDNLMHFWQGLSWNMLAPTINKYAPKIVFIVLLVLLAQTFAELTWSFFDDSEKLLITKNVMRSTAIQETSNRQSQRIGLNQVAQYHLFGNAKGQEQQIQRKIINAPDTRLRLILKGVFAATIAKKALAIIATKKGKGQIYRIGDKLSGGALLHAVYADRVILKRNNKLETLRLPTLSTKNLSTKSPSVARRGLNVLTAKVKKQKLRALRQTLLTDPSKLWQDVRINPVMKNGKVRGYSLLHKDAALMNSLGLQKSDVILEVNGQSLSDPAVLYGLMTILSEKKDLAITIERNGQKQSIQLNF